MKPEAIDAILATNPRYAGATQGPWQIGMRNGYNANRIYAINGKDEHYDDSIADVLGIALHAKTFEIGWVPTANLSLLADAKLNAAKAILAERLAAAAIAIAENDITSMEPVGASAHAGAVHRAKDLRAALTAWLELASCSS